MFHYSFISVLLCSKRTAPVRRERFDTSSLLPGPIMACLSIPPQHWPFYAGSRPVILQTVDPWWSTAGKRLGGPRAVELFMAERLNH